MKSQFMGKRIVGRQLPLPTAHLQAWVLSKLCKRKVLNYLALWAHTFYFTPVFILFQTSQCYYFLKSGVGAGSVTLELDHNAYFLFLFRFVETWFHGAQAGQTHSVWEWPWTPEPPSLAPGCPVYSVPPYLLYTLGFEPRASYMLGQFSTDWATSAAWFLLDL